MGIKPLEVQQKGTCTGVRQTNLELKNASWKRQYCHEDNHQMFIPGVHHKLNNNPTGLSTQSIA